ncbi:MAG: ankyrin repeat domain-containing protein [Ignavibacteria bacterium]|nr:ankyrin repeat domain-containing protein [Ignavibacteria bacterium]
MKRIFVFILILFLTFIVSCRRGKKTEIPTKDTTPLSSKEVQDFFKCIKDRNYDKIKKLVSENTAYIYAIDSSTKEIQSPLIVSVIRGFNNIAEFFIQMNTPLNFKDVYGNSALHYCAKMDNTDVARLLLEKKANVNIQNLSKETPLHFAARYNHPEMVKLLLEYKADRGILNESGKTAYDIARENNSMKVLELLK